jgi:hypothetical protein
VVLLWRRSLASYLLALGECGRHDDLRGSGLPCLSLFCFFDLLKVASTRIFYSVRSGSYNETRGSIGGPEVVETLYSI